MDVNENKHYPNKMWVIYIDEKQSRSKDLESRVLDRCRREKEVKMRNMASCCI